MWLEVLNGLDAGRVVEVPAGEPFVLGRVRGVDLVVRDERVSRRHLELTALPDGRLDLRDLGSANGTLLGGEPVGKATLDGGEVLQIGDVRIAVLRSAPAARTPTPAVAPDPKPVAPDLTLSMVGRMVEQRSRPARLMAFGGLALAAVAAVAVVLIVRGGGDADPIPGVVRQLSSSVVRVEAARERGSGFVVGSGLVVTNAHVVNGGLPLSVAGGRSARLVGVAPCADLAVLRADTSGFRRVTLGGDAVQAGESVVAVGFPVGSDALTSTSGVVSAPRTAFRDPAPDVPAYASAILTDTALNPGNSGGPLANTRGQVIGVNAAARTTGSDGRTLQGQNFALPVAGARAVLARLRAGASPGWVGVTFTYPTLAALAERRLPAGLFVASVFPGTPAARAGVRVGDLIVAAGSRAVYATLASWCTAVGSAPVPSLTVVRDGRRRELRLAGDT